MVVTTRTSTVIVHREAACQKGRVAFPHVYAPAAALRNLANLRRDFPGMYGKWGFRDAVNMDTGHVSAAYLSLDQGMIMAALGNALDRDVLRRAFADRAFEREVRPVIGIEAFGARASAG